MLGGQPNHGLQLCFPFQLHASGWDLRLYDDSDYLSIDEIVELLSGPLGFTCWVSFAQIFSFIYC